MKSLSSLLLMAAIMLPLTGRAQVTVADPTGKLAVEVKLLNGKPVYNVTYDGVKMLDDSPLGLVTDYANLSDSLTIKSHEVGTRKIEYANPHIKRSDISKEANTLSLTFTNPQDKEMTVEFVVEPNNVAYRYVLPKKKRPKGVRVMDEKSGFAVPSYATAFLTPQSDPMIGYCRTKPSYEEEYILDAPLTQKSQYGKGFTFPGLFRMGDKGWMLISETGLDRNYAGCRLSDYENGIYKVEFPMPGENNGNGTIEPAFSLPASTPWRTITVGKDLAPIVETTITWDVVEPLYQASTNYKPARSTWGWILWQDNAMNESDIKQYIALAKEMGYEYTLIDAWWDKAFGHDGMEKLIAYSRSQGVEPALWYSSSGYWNDIENGPVNRMDNPRIRRKEMEWLQKNGVKAIKVDFFGGDKQETIRLYEDILADANDHGIMVIFHGCTLPRGWEKMYPNYIGSEAVLASENLVFSQHFCDKFPQNASLHPFVRNAVGSMEFGGTFLNKRLNRGNDGGSIRRTTDAFELATAILFQNPMQNFALAPNNLTDADPLALEFMKTVPTLWTDTKYIDGYPGKYVALIRNSGDKVYVAGVNGDAEAHIVQLPESLIGKRAELLVDGKNGKLTKKAITINKGNRNIPIAPNGGFVATISE